MRALIFIILIIPIIPLHILGLIIFTWRIRRVIIPQNISGTAAEPYGARLLMHIAGTRIDNTAYKIAEHMILYTPPVNFLMLQTTWLALKISGYKGYIFGYPGQRPSTLMTMMSHRSDFFDRSINEALTRTENPIEQLVILGAGWDTRCYDLPKELSLNCFEVDMAPTLNAKKQAVEKAEIPHDHVTFVETDFNQESWMDALLTSGFDPNKTTYILWEGVTMYLTDEAVNSTLALFSTLPQGSVIGADFFTEDIVKGNPPLEKISKTIHTQIKYYSENFQFGIPTGETLSEGLEEYLSESELKLTRFEHVGSTEDRKPPWYFLAHIEKH